MMGVMLAYISYWLHIATVIYSMIVSMTARFAGKKPPKILHKKLMLIQMT